MADEWVRPTRRPEPPSPAARRSGVAGPAAAILRMQATAGNRAVSALLSRQRLQRVVDRGAALMTRVRVIETGEEGDIVGSDAGGYFVDVGDGLTPDHFTFVELDPVTTMGPVFADRPSIFEPIVRRGHNFPERQGLPGDLTVLTLVRNHSRLILSRGVEHADGEELDFHLETLMNALQEIHSESVPLMLEAIDLARQYSELGDARIEAQVEGETDEMVDLRERVAAIAAQVDAVKDDEELLETKTALGKVLTGIFWLNASSTAATLEHPERKFQVETRERLRSGGGPEGDAFAGAFVDYSRKEDDDNPYQTAGHTEQSLIVSRQWLELRFELLTLLMARETVIGELRDAWDAQLEADEDHFEAAVELTTTLYERLGDELGSVTISLNRSPCPICTQFLIAELVRFWEDVAGWIDLDGWKQARDLLRDLLRFELTYSHVYTDSAAHIEEFNAALEGAGWFVTQHEQYVKEADEVEFTTTQGAYGGALTSVLEKRKPRRKPRAKVSSSDSGQEAPKKKRKKADSDDEYVPSDDGD